MKKNLILFALFISSAQLIYAQSTAVDVYQIFQAKCTNTACHTSSNTSGNLDLVGSGTNPLATVYNNLVNANPSNTFANTQGQKRIYQGRLDKSLLYRMLTPDFDDFIQLDAQELGDTHSTLDIELSNTERELIRQWIVFGAPASSYVVDQNLIDDYYNVNGLASFPDGPPPSPSDQGEEGFQIRMGPFFLTPAGEGADEKEFFQKYALDMEVDKDVNRIDVNISNYSHHMIIYDYDAPAFAELVQAGLRPEPYHVGIGLVAAVQEAVDLQLPEGTAFNWENDLVLDLNCHYINYSSTNTYKAEAYLNIYTSESGSAAQEMHTELLVNDGIYIPNNGEEVTFEEEITDNIGELYLWGIMGHTHKYGTDYKLYKRLSNGEKGEMIYDGSCAEGVPGCVAPNFDYQHIPFRYIEPLEPVTMNASNGIIHEASWINNGPSDVWFGPTSDDEMMVLVVMFVTDTTGLLFTDTKDVYSPLDEVIVYPNPMSEYTVFKLPAEVSNISLTLFDVLGRKLFEINNNGKSEIRIERASLKSGMYLYRMDDGFGHFKTGKLMVK